MAQTTQELPRDRWTSYFDDFSRRIGTVEVTVEVEAPDLGTQIEADRVLLTGVTYDHGDDVLVIGLDAPGGEREDAERVISHPQRIFVEGEFAEEGMAIAVEDAEGQRTIVTLARPPALPPAGAG
jgi:Family of unknown function (DUF5335)